MDEVKIKSGFSCKILSKLITKMIEKKLGPGIEIHLSDVQIWKEESDLRYHLSANIVAEANNGIVEDLICKKRSGSGTN